MGSFELKLLANLGMHLYIPVCVTDRKKELCKSAFQRNVLLPSSSTYEPLIWHMTNICNQYSPYHHLDIDYYMFVQ